MAALLAVGAVFERRGRLRTHHAWVAAVPIIGVNTVAFYGQFSYFRTLAEIPLVMQVIMAAALESIAVYLAWKAHQAQLADDSALRLRLGAYLVALGIGALNYWHWCGPHWHATPLAVVFALASAISPWLWSVHSRRESRDVLKAQDKIEDHAVRLGGTRWFWHPYRCLRVTRAATWAGVTRPAEAIALVQFGRKPDRAPGSVPAADPDHRRMPSVSRGAGKTLPRPRPVVHAPRVSGLTVARAGLEHELVQHLLGSAAPWPGRNALADDDRLASLGSESTRRRFAARVLTLARTAGNGSGESHDGEHGA